MTEQTNGLHDPVPIFPLPEAVLFPHQVLPLHLFEPRYRALAQDATRGQRLIAVAHLKPGFEQLYFTHRAPIHPIVGVGRIIDFRELPDGRFTLVLRGMARARVEQELTGRPYRLGCLRVLESWTSAAAAECQELRDALCGAVECCLKVDGEAREGVRRVCEEMGALGDLTDLLAGCLPLDAGARQELLAECNATNRARWLLEKIQRLRETLSAEPERDVPQSWNFN